MPLYSSKYICEHLCQVETPILKLVTLCQLHSHRMLGMGVRCVSKHLENSKFQTFPHIQDVTWPRTQATCVRG